MDFTYKAYCMGRMLIDKSIGYIYSKNADDIGKTQRIYNRNRGISGSLYDLTYQSTYILDNIYLGNAYNARNYYDLLEKNIGLIINCTDEIPNYFQDHFEYHRIDVKDINHANIYPHLDETVTKMHEFIESSENKYSTMVGERGVKLSGGQRQRIGLARALYKKSELLLLDEATSALDNCTEDAVMKSIKQLKRKVTLIIIAHRLSTIKNCDKIILLSDGQIIGIGTYKELMNTNENFRKMVFANNGTR